MMTGSWGGGERGRSAAADDINAAKSSVGTSHVCEEVFARGEEVSAYKTSSIIGGG